MWGVWTHNRNTSNRYMLSTSDKEDEVAASKQKILLSPDSLLLLQKTGEKSKLIGDVVWRQATGGQRGLGTAYIYTREEGGR